MTTEYLKLDRPLTDEQVPADLRSNNREGKPVLNLSLYYMKDARRRGLKLSISRRIVTDMGFNYFPMSPYNATLHIGDMQRKNDKIGREAAALIERNAEKIHSIATASENPDWQAIMALLADPAT